MAILSRPVESRVFSGKLRKQGLDILRAFAIFLVIGYHTAYRFPPVDGDPIAHLIKYSGWIGVDLFFAISGFLITGILIRDRARRDIRGFFLRRIFRIVPLFFVAMTVFTVLALATGQESEKLHLLWSPALMANGWTIPFLGLENIPYSITWSLSVEETAYILLGLACFFGTRQLRYMLVAFVLTSSTLRLAIVATNSLAFSDIYFFVPARLDALALGGFGALGWYRQIIGLRWAGFVSASLVLTLIWVFQYIPLSHPVMPIAGYFAFGLSSAVLVTWIGVKPDQKQLHGNRLVASVVIVLASFGKRSYFIYLFHLFLLAGLGWIQERMPGTPLSFWTALPITCMATYALALISWRFFEYPLIQRGQQRR